MIEAIIITLTAAIVCASLVVHLRNLRDAGLPQLNADELGPLSRGWRRTPRENAGVDTFNGELSDGQ